MSIERTTEYRIRITKIENNGKEIIEYCPYEQLTVVSNFANEIAQKQYGINLNKEILLKALTTIEEEIKQKPEEELFENIRKVENIKDKLNKEEYLEIIARDLTTKMKDNARDDIPEEIIQKAKDKGIVIVYGASDDLMEFRGALYDEFDCYEGDIFYFDREGQVIEKETQNKIEAVWCGKDTDWTWSYKTNLPHETFEILDDEEKFCLGIVFYKEDLK